MEERKISRAEMAPAELSGGSEPRAPRQRVWWWLSGMLIAGFIGFVAWVLFKPNPYIELSERYDYHAYSPTPDSIGVGISPMTLGKLLVAFADVEKGRNLSEAIYELEKQYNHAKWQHWIATDAIAWNLAFAYLKSGEGGIAKELLAETVARHKDVGAAAPKEALALILAIEAAE